MTESWPIPVIAVGSRRTAARVTPGAISLSSSSHFAHKSYSKLMKPVALPPGLASGVRIVLGRARVEYADTAYAVGLLCAGCKRRRCHRSEKRNEVTPLHACPQKAQDTAW